MPYVNADGSPSARNEDLFVYDAPDATPLTPAPAPTSVTAPRSPNWTIPPTMNAVEAQRAQDRLRAEWSADPHHVLADERHPEHKAALDYYLALGDVAAGHDPVAGAKILGEVNANGQMRAPGSDALTPMALPTLPANFAFDERAIRTLETAAHEMGASPGLLPTVVYELQRIAEQAQARGVAWSETLAREELDRQYGADGARRLLGDARYVYELLDELDPHLSESLYRLVATNDPSVVKLLGATVYRELIEGAMTPAKERLVLRMAERQMKEEAEGRERTAKLRREQAAEDDQARADDLSSVAQLHNRWGRNRS